MPPLLPHERRVRMVIVAALLGGGIVLWHCAPALPAVAPKCVFHSLTGLPCAFCGATRSVCAVAGGEWARALELNAAGIVVVGFVFVFLAVAGIEVVRGRALWDWGSAVRRGARFLPLAGAVLVAWWGVHVIDALQTPNEELVDFSNPVARRVACWLGVDFGGEQRKAGE